MLNTPRQLIQLVSVLLAKPSTFRRRMLTVLAGAILLLQPLPDATAADLPIRINAGGPTVGEWLSDTGFAQGGAAFPFKATHDASSALGAAPNQVYQTVRHTDHRYDFPKLADGNYVVRLHFTDAFKGHGRAMKYRIEGHTVIDEFSIYDEAGERSHFVIVRDFPVKVGDGNGLQIECLKANGNDVFEAAVEVFSADGYKKMINASPLASVTRASESLEPKMPLPVAKPVKLPAAIADVSDEVSRQLLELTGGRRVRLVWSQVDKESDLMVTNGKSTQLYGLDTGDDRGERLIFEDKGGYSKPLLTPSGERIIYTNQKEGKCYVSNWDGSDHHTFAQGFASDIWRDPETGIDWVYVRNSVGNANGPLVRRQLNRPDVVETVWDRSPVGNSTVPWFRLSADGKFAADAFPWPKCGIADMNKKSFQLLGNGCWTSIAPDNSYRFFHFMGNHVELAMFDYGNTEPRMIKLNTMENMAGKKAYHPRWSSDARFLTATGPERNWRSELYLGRFDAGFTRVEKWVRVTKNKLADYYGAAWIEPSADSPPSAAFAAAKPVEPESAPQPEFRPSGKTAWPGSQSGLVYLWENNSSNNQVLDEKGSLVRICSGELRGMARFTRHFGLDLRHGFFEAERISDEFLSAAHASNELTIEAIITSSSDKQSGLARIVSFSSGSSSRNFTLGQDGDQLVFRLRTPKTGDNGTSPEVRLGRISGNEPTHVMVRYRQGKLDAFVNGKLSTSSDVIRGGFENWTPQQLLFGDEVGGGRNWSGMLEGIAIYSRSLSDEEVQWHYEQSETRISGRKAAAQVVVDAELVEASRVPDVKEIGSYRRSIVRNLYLVRKVISGEAPSVERIVVTEWAILDRKPLAGAASKVGDVRRMTLEPFDQHPELKSDWVQDDLSVFDAPVYHRVGP